MAFLAGALRLPPALFAVEKIVLNENVPAPVVLMEFQGELIYAMGSPFLCAGNLCGINGGKNYDRHT